MTFSEIGLRPNFELHSFNDGKMAHLGLRANSELILGGNASARHSVPEGGGGVLRYISDEEL